jgi:Holliday junction resolvase RusA-like endonuclease
LRIEFTVHGEPQPAGSKRGFAFKRKNGSTGVAISDANPKSAEWKRYVKLAAATNRPDALVLGAVSVSFEFFRVRPGGHFNTKGELNKKGREKPYPTSKPDALKLARGVEDALTGVIWLDDAQIVEERLSKRWGDAPGVRVVIETLDAAEPPSR